MRTWHITCGLAALVICAVSLGCDGFFVDPVMTGLAVGPTTSIQTGATVQMTAVGTYNDGSQKKLASDMYWSSGTPTVATVSKSGLVVGVGPGQSVITGACETLTGSATITVVIGGLSSIIVTSQDGLTNITYGSSEQFIATGTANGKQFEITNSVTWSTNPQAISSVSIDPGTGLLTTTSGGTDTTSFEVIASDPTTGLSDRINFTVHP